MKLGGGFSPGESPPGEVVSPGESPPGAARPRVTFLAGTRKVTKRSAFKSTSDLTQHPNQEPIHIPLEVSHQIRSPTPQRSVPPRLRGTGAPAPPPNCSTNASRPCSARRFGCFFGCLTRAQHPYLEATVCQSACRPHFVVLLGRRNRVTRWMSQAQMCVAFEALLFGYFLLCQQEKVTRRRAAPGGLSPSEKNLQARSMHWTASGRQGP